MRFKNFYIVKIIHWSSNTQTRIAHRIQHEVRFYTPQKFTIRRIERPTRIGKNSKNKATARRFKRTPAKFATFRRTSSRRLWIQNTYREIHARSGLRYFTSPRFFPLRYSEHRIRNSSSKFFTSYFTPPSPSTTTPTGSTNLHLFFVLVRPQIAKVGHKRGQNNNWKHRRKELKPSRKRVLGSRHGRQGQG